MLNRIEFGPGGRQECELWKALAGQSVPVGLLPTGADFVFVVSPGCDDPESFLSNWFDQSSPAPRAKAQGLSVGEAMQAIRISPRSGTLKIIPQAPQSRPPAKNAR